MTERTVVITGGNSGIGLAAAATLRRHGWRAAITARDAGRGEQALAEIQAAGSGPEPQLLSLDLARFDSARSCAADALERLPRIDVLINNAGINVSERRVTEDGIERMLQVNYFGHFLLTGLLFKRLLESDDARVVNVSSTLHTRADGIDLEDLRLERRWGRLYPYAASKLANVLFTRELSRRYEEQGLTSIAVHPGGVRSQLGADGDLGGLFGLIWRLGQFALLSTETGAAPIVEAATEASMRAHSGAYFHRHQLRQPSAAALDEQAARALWRRSAELTGAGFPEMNEARE